MSTQTNQVNLDFLHDFAKGDLEKIKKYISMYLKTAPQIIAQLQELLDIDDLDTLKRSAHSVKSQAKYMGANELSDIMQKIELKSTTSANHDLLQGLISQANNINEIVNDSLTEHLEQL